MRGLLGSLVAAYAIAKMAVAPASFTITVPARGDLQQALNAARPGETILLEPSAVYVGSFVLPPRTGSDPRPIVVRTGGQDAVPAGQRMTREASATLAKIQSPDDTPALRTSPGSRFWRIELMEFLPTRGGLGEIVALGDGSTAQKTLDEVPTDLTIDRAYIHGDPRDGQKRGIALNSAETTISNSIIADIKAIGVDSQAIAGWNGPGGYLIENNYLEAAGDNFILGGTDPSIPGLTPTRIVVRGNTIAKPQAWHEAGSPWQIKNLFELKNARDVTVERNILERNWQAAQSGYAILFTVRNQDGACPWCQVEQVQFRQNIVRDVAAGVAILGIDPNHPSRQTSGILIQDNLFDRIDSRAWGGDGSWLQLTDRPRDITVDHNTVIQDTSNGVVKVDGPVAGFQFTNNIASHGAYGIIATNHGVGNDSIRASFPGATIARNVLAGGESGLYPPRNFFPSLQDFRRQFVNFEGGDFRVSPTSPWMRAGTDGLTLGAKLPPDPSLPIPQPLAWQD